MKHMWHQSQFSDTWSHTQSPIHMPYKWLCQCSIYIYILTPQDYCAVIFVCDDLHLIPEPHWFVVIAGMPMHVRMHACTDVCMLVNVHMDAHKHITLKCSHTYTYPTMHVYVLMHASGYTHMHIYICIFAHIHPCMCPHTHVCMDTCRHIEKMMNMQTFIVYVGDDLVMCGLLQRKHDYIYIIMIADTIIALQHGKNAIYIYINTNTHTSSVLY